MAERNRMTEKRRTEKSQYDIDRLKIKKKNGYRRLKLVMVLFCLAVFLCACSFQNTKVILTTGFQQKEIFKLGSMSCGKSETLVYLYNMQKQYEKVYGTDIWDISEDMITNLKDNCLERLARIKAMNQLAKQYGIVLSDKEQEKAQQCAEDYYASLNASEIKLMGINKENLTEMYCEYALAEKIYHYIISDVVLEISDDEARTITVSQIFVKTYYEGVAGSRITYTTEEKITAYQKILEAQRRLESGESFETLAAEYNDVDEITLSFGKGVKEQAYEEAAFNLGNGEVSGIVETVDGYAIIKCTNTFNEEETIQNKEKILELRKREAFDSCYEDFASKLDRSLNEEAWNSITISDAPNLMTSSFWTTYEGIFNE